MAKHQMQHRPKRDTRNNKELIDLKRENQTLKRKIAKLQKYTQKLLESVQVLPEEEQLSVAAETSAKPVDGCLGCGNKSLTHVTLPTGTMIACKSCGWRKKNVGISVL